MNEDLAWRYIKMNINTKDETEQTKGYKKKNEKQKVNTKRNTQFATNLR